MDEDIRYLLKLALVIGFGIAFVVFMVTLGCLGAYFLVESVR